MPEAASLYAFHTFHQVCPIVVILVLTSAISFSFNSGRMLNQFTSKSSSAAETINGVFIVRMMNVIMIQIFLINFFFHDFIIYR